MIRVCLLGRFTPHQEALPHALNPNPGVSPTSRGTTASRLLDVIDQWRPDVLVRDEGDFVAAERRGIPHASIVVLAAGGLIRPDLLAEPLNALRADHGLPADPNLPCYQLVAQARMSSLV